MTFQFTVTRSKNTRHHRTFYSRVAGRELVECEIETCSFKDHRVGSASEPYGDAVPRNARVRDEEILGVLQGTWF